MSVKEQELILNLKRAVSVLPDEKLNYIQGYAEGVLAMAAVVTPPQSGRAHEKTPLLLRQKGGVYYWELSLPSGNT